MPISGFYEWEAIEGQKVKQPWYFTPAEEGGVFAIAGLWESWGPERVETFTLLTRGPNELLGRFHDRMPCILPPELWDQWLDCANLTPELPAFHAEGMMGTRVSTLVNSPRNNGADLIREVGLSG